MLRDALENLKDPSIFEIRVIDYGIAKLFDDDNEEAKDVTKYTRNIGCSILSSPELANELDMPYDSRVDIWSIGSFMLLLLNRD